MRTLMIAGILAVSVAAHAQYTGPGAQPESVTVKQLQDSGKKDQHVILRGRLVKALGDDKYQFADASGEIPVKIDHHRWPSGQAVSDSTMVELTGKYDKEFVGASKVKVRDIRIVPALVQ
ncbi:NirD/YgiW/YdeI family stress tolerance protein [Caballeronia sp. TF1N1]|uniref:NirD/YgiW/YdeI family stress tolerance protein n=1 Tax=Caballeronia sp. TF1N1 TaxID=2878153 RepID=UPI001FD28ADA|nr:NirD/YgiW/YdeI family stress tolerance protein [Caballeronia sp. TF1N1]